MSSRRKELGLSAERIAEILGVSPATIYRYENGSIDKVPGDRLAPIADALRTTPAYLMGWEDAPSLSPSNDYSTTKNIIPLPQTKKIPLLGDIACGTPILAEENISDYLDADVALRADFALRCHGDSMINARIFDGDIVYIRIQPTVENGEIAAVCIDEEATLKRVRIFDDHISLEAENPHYRPLVYWGNDMSTVRIIGRAVAFTSTIL